MYRLRLVVRPRDGVRDPQAEAVQRALGSVGHGALTVHCVGRYLRLDVAADSEAEARARAHDMCRRLLVNPSLETYELSVEPAA